MLIRMSWRTEKTIQKYGRSTRRSGKVGRPPAGLGWVGRPTRRAGEVGNTTLRHGMGRTDHPEVWDVSGCPTGGVEGQTACASGVGRLTQRSGRPIGRG